MSDGIDIELGRFWVSTAQHIPGMPEVGRLNDREVVVVSKWQTMTFEPGKIKRLADTKSADGGIVYNFEHRKQWNEDGNP